MTEFHYHLELTPPQLKLTHTALRSLLDDFGHDQPEIVAIIREILAKLPDEHAIRAIRIDGAPAFGLPPEDDEPPTGPRPASPPGPRAA